MKITRRDFLKISGAGAGALLAYGAMPAGALIPRTTSAAGAVALKTRVKETASICAYCGGGCGIIVSSDSDGIVKVEGDADNLINRGAICSKGQAIAQVHQVNGQINPKRLTRPLYRPANASAWQEISWEEAFAGIAARIKATRDANWTATETSGETVNRTEAIASLGGAALDNEECYALSKMLRSLGLVYIEHQARI